MKSGVATIEVLRAEGADAFGEDSKVIPIGQSENSRESLE